MSAWLKWCIERLTGHNHTGGDDGPLLDGSAFTSTAWAGTAEIADIAAAEAAGTSTKPARGDHVHTIGSGVVTNGMLAGLITLAKLLGGVDAGSFSPVLFGGGTAGTFTYGFQTGRYCRIGPVVFVQFGFSIATIPAAATGNLGITLPITALNSASLFGSLGMEWSTVNLSAGYTHLSGRMSSNSAVMNLAESTDNGAVQLLQGSTVAVGFQIVCNGFYFAA